MSMDASGCTTTISTQADSPRDALIRAFQRTLAEFDARPGGFPSYCRVEIDIDPNRALGFAITKVKQEILIARGR